MHIVEERKESERKNLLSRRGCLVQESSYSESGDRELMKCVGNDSDLKFNGNQDSGHDSWSGVPYIFGSRAIRAKITMNQQPCSIPVSQVGW